MVGRDGVNKELLEHGIEPVDIHIPEGQEVYENSDNIMIDPEIKAVVK